MILMMKIMMIILIEMHDVDSNDEHGYEVGSKIHQGSGGELAGNTFQARSTNPAIITVFVHAIELIYQEYANALTMWCPQNPSHPSPVCKTQHCTFLQSLPNEPHGCILNPLVHQLTN